MGIFKCGQIFKSETKNAVETAVGKQQQANELETLKPWKQTCRVYCYCNTFMMKEVIRYCSYFGIDEITQHAYIGCKKQH